jgi:hypothetical protein
MEAAAGTETAKWYSLLRSLTHSEPTEVQVLSIVTALAGGLPSYPNTVALAKHQFYVSCIAFLIFFSVYQCQLSLCHGSYIKYSSTFARAFFRACP